MGSRLSPLRARRIAWIYSDPAALKQFAGYSSLPDNIVRRVPDFFPKESMAPDRMVDMDPIVADAGLPRRWKKQVEELVQIPKP